MGNCFPPKPYTEVESEYVRDAIREGDFDDLEHRRRVNDLVSIERYVLDSPSGFAGGIHFASLSRRHPAAHDAIQRELDPEGFRERRRRETERDLECRARRERKCRERAEKRRRHREEWEAVQEVA